MIAPNTRNTKDRLLDEAEKLFAEYGIEAVSSRQIALAASQGNQSAILYHFGSKDDLISALLARRVSEINHARRAMLAEISGAGEPDMRALVGAVALPLAKWIDEHENGGCYVRFLAHLWSDRKRRDIANEQSEDAAPLRLIFTEMRKLAPALPEALWLERSRLAVGGIVYALASRERLRALGEGLGTLPQAAFVNNLIDAAVAILLASASDATLGSMVQQRSLSRTTPAIKQLRKAPTRKMKSTGK